MAVDLIKVLHLITGLDTGGAEVNLQRLIDNMDRDRFENMVVSLTTHGPMTEEIREHGIRVELADGIPDSRVATARFVPRYSGWTLMIHNVFC